MMKSGHLKMYIDRLMMVPKKPLHGEKGDAPIHLPKAELPNEKTDVLGKGDLSDGAKGHGGAGDLEDLHDPLHDEVGLAHLLERDTIPEEHSIEDKRDDMHPQSVKSPHIKKESSYGDYDDDASSHEKKVLSERARHAKIFGAH